MHIQLVIVLSDVKYSNIRNLKIAPNKVLRQTSMHYQWKVAFNSTKSGSEWTVGSSIKYMHENPHILGFSRSNEVSTFFIQIGTILILQIIYRLCFILILQ